MDRFCWTLIGPTGSGKSYLWKQMFGQFPRPVVALDRVGDCEDVGLTVSSAEHLRRYLLAYVEGKVQGPKNGAYVVEHATKKNGEALFKLAHESGMGGTYIVDEAHNWYPTGGTQDQNLHKMLMEGRHDAQSIVFCTRRPQNLGKNALNESAVTCFAINDPGARTRAARYMGPDVDEHDINALGQHEFITGGRARTLPFDLSAGEDPTRTVCRYDAKTGEIKPERTL